MTPEERQLLSELAERVKNAPAQQRDAEAEQFIRQLVRDRPDTAYILAQTVLMQDFALRNAEAQIQDLQDQLDGPPPPGATGSGSFLGGAPGVGRSSGGSVPRVNPWGQPGRGPGPGDYPPQGGGYPGPGPMIQPSQTGGFLRGAAQTAAGVAGGALLFQGINSLFSGHHEGGSILGGGEHTGSLTQSTFQDQGDRGGYEASDFDETMDNGGGGGSGGDDGDFA